MAEMGKAIALLGAALVVLGLCVIVLSKSGINFGRLPGDIVYRGKNATVYFPIVTSILLSVVVSAIFYLINRFRR
jgi:hypothetical protein